MRPKWLVGIIIGTMLLYFSFFGLSGLSSLHPLSVSDGSGLHYFVDACEQGGTYTDIQASISTSRIVNVPTIPESTNAFIAGIWIACEQRVGNSNPTWFMQVGWVSVAQNLAGTPTAMYYDTVFWATTQTNYVIQGVESISPGEVHDYEIKQESDGWHMIVDGATVKVVAETGSCNMIDVCEELTSPQPAQWSPGAIDCGQIVFSSMMVTSSGGQSWPFLEPLSGGGVVRDIVDSGGNGIVFNSPTQLTEGWGLPTSPVYPTWMTSPSQTSYTLTTSVVGSGSISLDPSGGTYESGTRVALTAYPNSGSTFVGWTGVDSSDGNVASVTMNSARTVTAKFSGSSPSQTAYTITASVGSGGSISPSGSVSVSAGNSQTFSITASSGYQIQDVEVDGTSKGAISSYTFTNVNSNHAISVTFSVGSTPPIQGPDWSAIWQDLNSLVNTYSQMIMVAGVFITGLSTIMLFTPKPKREVIQ